MAISELDTKLLWGRAAGLCSKPSCGTDLTKLPIANEPYIIGEMAHVIARSPKGPRAHVNGGDDSYSNLILLCPNCHRDVDKAPEGVFSVDNLHEWKNQHEARVRALGTERIFQSNADLSKAIRAILYKNKAVWKDFGPQSIVALKDPSSNAADIWTLRRLDTIVLGNRSIINMITANQDLLTEEQSVTFADFCSHAEAYENHVINPIDCYPLFPKEFEKAFAHAQ